MKNKQNPTSIPRKWWLVNHIFHQMQNKMDNNCFLPYKFTTHIPRHIIHQERRKHKKKKRKRKEKKRKGTIVKVKNGTNLSQLSIDIAAIILVMIIILIYCIPL